MRITRLKLVNFIGIKHGLGKNEIEIDFHKTSKSKIVMLNGGNGSGKSTIISQLHPFKDSFDDRKTVILEDEEGLKEIDIQDGDNFYEISHYYKKIAQSFVKKNGVEMNENGGVKTFNAFILSEFGLTNDYFKIGKIGSNTENFIQFTATERKQYISKFLPHIEDYLEKFEIVKDKFRLATNDIKVVSGDLGKLEEEETVKSKIATFEGVVKSLDNEIEKKSGEVAVHNSHINDYTTENSGIDIAAVILDRTAKEKRKNDIMTKGEIFIAKYDGKKDTTICEAIIEDKTLLVSTLNSEIATFTANKDSFNSLVISADNDIKKYQFNLQELQETDSIETIKNQISISEKNIKNIQEQIDTDELMKLVQINIATISGMLSKFEAFKNFTAKYYTDLNKSSLVPAKTNIEMFLEDSFANDLEKQIINMRNIIIQKKAYLETKKSDIYKKEANLGKVAILEQRPDKCYIDTCPFIKDALQYKNLPDEIKVLEGERDQLAKDIASYEIKAENIEELKSLYLNFTNSFDQMNPRNNKVYEYFIQKNGNLLTNVRNPLGDFMRTTDSLITDINDKLTTLQIFNVETTKLESLNYKKKFIENNETYKKQIQNSINEKIVEKEKFTKKYNDTVAAITEKLVTLNSETEILNDYKDYLSGKKEITSLSTIVSTLKTTEINYLAKAEAIKSEQALLMTTNASLIDYKSKKAQASLELSKARTILSNIELLKAKKESLEKDYNYLRIVKDCLDPNRGIPLYFIKSYLEKTKDIVNELLELAFEGNFEINFVTDSREFYIQVRAGENVKNDIKEASQGEIALTTISISLALIEQAIGKYNILALDEIDGPLDANNRGNFLSILNKQIDKLDIEQVFVISHNDAFDTEAMDLILLKDSNVATKGDEFMRNKEIIFEV